MIESPYHKIELPDGESDGAKIVNFEITKQEVETARMRACFRRYDPYDPPPEAGNHTKLLVNGEVMMSDTEMEKRSNLTFIRRATGDVLIAGLGIGLIIHPILGKPEVTSITVVENHPGVIAMVAKSVAHPKLTIIQDDIFTWKTKQKFDTIYFDIWPNISPDNLPEMAKLNRRFARNLKPGGWRGAWMQDKLKSDRRQAPWGR